VLIVALCILGAMVLVLVKQLPTLLAGWELAKVRLGEQQVGASPPTGAFTPKCTCTCIACTVAAQKVKAAMRAGARGLSARLTHLSSPGATGMWPQRDPGWELFHCSSSCAERGMGKRGLKEVQH